MKRLLSFLLVTILVVASIPASVLSAFAADTSFVSVNAPAEITYTGDSENDSFTVSFALTLASDVAGVAGYEILLKWDAQLLALADTVAVKSDGLHTVNLDNVSSGYAKIVVANATDVIGAGTLFEATFYPLADKADAVIAAEVQRMSTASGFIACNGCETAVSLVPLPPVTVRIEDHPILTDKNADYTEAWNNSSTQDVVLIRNENCSKTAMDVELIYSIGKTIFVDSVSLYFYHCPEAMIGYPEGMADVFVSKDGKEYSKVGTFEFADAALAVGSYGTVENTFSFPAAEAFYVKVCFTVDSSTDVLGDAPSDGKIFWEYAALTEFSISRYCEHNYTLAEHTEATCTTSGFKTFVCQECNDRYTETIDTLGHSTSDWIVTLPATCTTDGSHYRECTRCKLLLETERIDAFGHSAEDWTVIQEATCSNAGKRVKSCTICGTVVDEETIPQTNVHVPGEPIVSKEPTCTATGFQYINCVYCNFPIKSERIPAKGHAYDEGTVTLAPTCESNGSMLYTCTECSHSYTADIEKSEHKAVDIAFKAPTCTEAGYRKQACEFCQLVLTDELIPATDHDYESSVTTPATCTQTGVMTYLCSACGDSYTQSIDMIDHIQSDWLITTAPTCSSAGTKIIKCTSCESVLSTENIDPLEHTAGDAVIKEASCTEDGSQTISCTVCQAVIASQTLPALGHVESDWVVTQAPTCAQDGTKEQSCTVCQELLASETVPATGHSESDWLTLQDASCTQDGSREKRCQVCNTTLVSETIPAIGHQAGDEEITNDATCLENGSAVIKCTLCGDILETKEVPAIGHAMGEWEVQTPATCTAEGENVKKCTACGEILERETAEALGHAYDNGAVTTEPSCETEGVKTFVCQNCKDSYQEPVSARGHTASEWKIIEDATADKDGVKAQLCTACGKTLATAIIPKHISILPDAEGKPTNIEDLWGSGNATEENITLVPNPSGTLGTNVTLVQTFGELLKIESISLSLYHCAESGIGYPEGSATVLASSDGINYSPVGTFELAKAELAIGKAGTIINTFAFESAIEACSIKILLHIGESTDILGPAPDGGKTYWKQIGVLSLNASQAPDVPKWVKGDVDGNGSFETLDYMKLKRYILGTFDLDEAALARSDIDLDGEVTAIDYMMLKRIFLGTHSFPS